MAFSQWLGNTVDYIGTALGAKEWGLSEGIAGGGTTFTGLTPQSQSVGFTPAYNPNYGLNPYVKPEKIYTKPQAPTNNTAPTGDVLGTNDNNNNGGGGPSEYEQYLNNLYSSLGSAYNKMQGELDPMYQRRKGEIENLANIQGQNIGLQEQAGLDALNTQRQGVETNQVRNLKDLSNAISQSYNTFANQLGTMGAGDSSASRVMLPYALSRAEAQQRGQINRTTADKIGEINARETQLRNTVMQERNKLEQAKMSELAALGEWFDNAKMQISQMRLSDAKAAGENALNYALQQLNRIQSNFDNRKAALDSWAISNSKDLASLKQNLGAMTDPSLVGSLPGFNLSGLSQGNGVNTSASQAPVGFGYGNTEDIFKKLGVV